MGEWVETVLADVARGGIQGGPFGSQLHASDYVKDGVPLIMPKNIGRNVFRYDQMDFVSEVDALRLKTHRVQPGDIVVARKGELGRRVFVTESESGWLCGTDCIRIRPDRGRVFPRFLFYYLGLASVASFLWSRDSGSTMPNLNTKSLGELPVRLPPQSVQASIAAVLGALDDKIAVNERIAEATRSLGMAQFRAAVDTSSTEHDVVSVSAVLVRGVTPRYSDDPDALTVLNQKCIRGGRVSLGPARRTLGDRVPNNKLLQHGDVLVNSTGVGTLGRVARWTGEEKCTVDSHVTIVRFDETRVDSICAGFAMLAAQTEIERLGEGSTGQTELSRAKLGDFRITLPDSSSCRLLSPKLQALEARGDAALRENQSLAHLRDTLLPKLMSGELRVRDAEKMVEDAT